MEKLRFSERFHSACSIRCGGWKLMVKYRYTVIVERDENGGYIAYCPALHGCYTQGDTY